MARTDLSPTWIAALVLGLATVGCAQSEVQNSSPDNGPLTAPHNAPEADAWEPIAGERLLPLASRTTAVRVIEGPDEGRTLTQRMQPAKARDAYDEDAPPDMPNQADDDGAHWILMVDERRRAHLRLDDQGNVRVLREDDFEENVAVYYDPALVLVPATVEPGTVHEQEADVVVRRLDTGGVRSRGTCEIRIEAIGLGPVPAAVAEVEGDEARAYVLRQDRRLDLTLARATVRTETAYVPGWGRVAWRVDRETRTLGVIGSQRRERYELVSQDEPGDEEP